MAGVIVPLIAELAPSIINLIAGLVHKEAPIAEMNGPGTGPVKFAEVFKNVMRALTNASTAGTIKMPSDAEVKVVIQAVVSSMKLSGLLDDPEVVASAVAGTPQSVTLTSGQSVTITVP